MCHVEVLIERRAEHDTATADDLGGQHWENRAGRRCRQERFIVCVSGQDLRVGRYLRRCGNRALAGAKAAVGTRRGLNCRMEKAVFVRLHLDRGRRTNGNATATAGADIRNLRDVHKVSLKVSIAVLIFLIQRSGKTI